MSSNVSWRDMPSVSSGETSRKSARRMMVLIVRQLLVRSPNHAIHFTSTTPPSSANHAVGRREDAVDGENADFAGDTYGGVVMGTYVGRCGGPNRRRAEKRTALPLNQPISRVLCRLQGSRSRPPRPLHPICPSTARHRAAPALARPPVGQPMQPIAHARIK